MSLLSIELDLNEGAQGRAKYEVLRDHIAGQIEHSQLQPGEMLPTEQTLADALGVARSTVRQAMGALERNGLIRRIQGKGTFVHEDAPRRLQAGAELFALIVPETRLGFYPSLLYGFEAAARDNNCQAVVCNTENDVDKQGSAILQLIDKQISGVAIVPTTQSTTPAYHIRQLQQHRIPVVFCHRRVEGVPAPLLALPFEKIGRLAGKKLAEQGHRRVACFASQDSRSTQRYRLGLQSALQAVGGGCKEKDTWIGDSVSLDANEDKILRALKALLARPRRPTAIFATFDSLAELIYLQLGALGVRVPEDISLIGVGGTWREGAVVRRLTSVVVDEAAAARRAVQLLTEIRNGTRLATDGQRIELPPGVSNGQTLGPVPTDAATNLAF